jgi:hypothetical protein
VTRKPRSNCISPPRAGNPVAAMNLALDYRIGRGVTPDETEARKWAAYTPRADSPDLAFLTLSRTRLHGTIIDPRVVAAIRAAAAQQEPVAVDYEPMQPDPRLPTFGQVLQELKDATAR